jgi:light-harvesting complex II chlorophyll a/b binding protein 5
MAAMAAAKAEFLGQSVVASKSDVVAQKQGGALRVVSLFSKGKQVAKQVKKAVPKAATAAKKAVPKATTAVKRTAAKVNRPNNEELAKWYGPDRRIYLPEGLLSKDEIPAYLTGEVPGDYGYDPFGLSKKPADFDKYQAYELIHARWAMLGAAGFVLPEAFNKFGAVCGPEAVWWKTGALLLDGDTIQYFGATVPVNLAAAVIAEIVLVGGAEYYRSTNKSPLGSDLDRLHPGGAFDPLGLANDPDQFALLKVKEIKNGRLAMFSMLGFFVQAYVTGEGPVENLSAHLSDPFGNNLLTVLQGSAERVPSL